MEGQESVPSCKTSVLIGHLCLTLKSNEHEKSPVFLPFQSLCASVLVF